MVSRTVRLCRGGVLAGVSLAAASFAAPAAAVSVFEVDASATLELTSITGGSIGDVGGRFDAYLVDDRTDDLVAGASTTSGVTTAADEFGIGNLISLSAGVDGDSGIKGQAAADYLTEGSLFLENLSLTDTLTLNFALAFDVSAMVGIGDPAMDLGLAEATVQIFSDSGAADDLFTVFADSERDVFVDDLSNTLNFSVTLAPGGTDSFSLLVDASGFAVAEVPEPSTILLLLCLPLALGATVRR